MLTGNCGSGKSTISEILMADHHFGIIDGDCVLAVVREKTAKKGVAYNSPVVLDEISVMADILFTLGKNVVLSHVVLPDELDMYHRLVSGNGIRILTFVLKPSLEVTKKRNVERTCWPKTTPVGVIEQFHKDISYFNEDSAQDLYILDNSYQTACETANSILTLIKLHS